MGKQIKLVKMNEQEYEKYLEFIVPDFAKDLSRNFNKPYEVALEESKQMMERLFPNGFQTEGHYLHHVYDEQSGEKVGILWFFINNEIHTAFIYHIYIEEAYRGQGYGKVTLQQMEPVVKELGATSIGLNVFGHNEAAFNLYKKMGYTISAVNMEKKL